MKDKFKSVSFTAILLVSIGICIANTDEVGRSVALATERCINVIIPSMFIFMCLTTIMACCGIHKIIGLLFYPISRFVFKINTAHFGIFILSMFSGYPSGIKLLSDALKRHEISRTEFEHLSCFCFASGPAFISGTVSGTLYPHTSAGLLCFISVICGNIATAILYSFFSPSKNFEIQKSHLYFSSQNITDAVISSSKAIFQMCSMIIAFSGFFCIAKLSGTVGIISNILSSTLNINYNVADVLVSSFFEISNLVNLPCSSPELLPIICAFLSFGGICVFIQVIVISENLINIRKFITARAVSAILSALVCKLISRFFNLGVYHVFKPAVTECNYGVLPSVMLIFMIIILISTDKKKI